MFMSSLQNPWRIQTHAFGSVYVLFLAHCPNSVPSLRYCWVSELSASLCLLLPKIENQYVSLIFISSKWLNSLKWVGVRRKNILMTFSFHTQRSLDVLDMVLGLAAVLLWLFSLWLRLPILNTAALGMFSTSYSELKALLQWSAGREAPPPHTSTERVGKQQKWRGIKTHRSGGGDAQSTGVMNEWKILLLVLQQTSARTRTLSLSDSLTFWAVFLF